MPDPVTQTAGAAVAISTASTLVAAQAAAPIFGVPLDLLVWGAVGGLIALSYSEPRQPPLVGVSLALHAVSRLMAGSAVGGVLSGAALPVAAKSFSVLSGLPGAPLAPQAAALVMGMATAFLPEAFAYVRSFLSKRRAEQC